MSKYNYSQYKISKGDKVWAFNSGVMIKAIVCDSFNISRDAVIPRGKTKREFLKATKQGKWADAVTKRIPSVGDWVMDDANVAYTGARIIRAKKGSFCYFDAKQVKGIHVSSLRHATPEEVEVATKSVCAWEGARFAVRTHEHNAGVEEGGVFKVEGTAYTNWQGEKFIKDANGNGHCCDWCKPITPAEMTRQQLLSIVEGLD